MKYRNTKINTHKILYKLIHSSSFAIIIHHITCCHISTYYIFPITIPLFMSRIMQWKRAFIYQRGDLIYYTWWISNFSYRLKKIDQLYHFLIGLHKKFVEVAPLSEEHFAVVLLSSVRIIQYCLQWICEENNTLLTENLLIIIQFTC